MNEAAIESGSGSAGAFGVNYAVRPHKFVDRRVFVEVLNRYAGYCSLDNHVYVGLGSFAMEDHKLINAAFGTQILISLEIDTNVLARQKFNAPLACITPTPYSTDDFVTRKSFILREVNAEENANTIIWFDMTDAVTLSANLNVFRELLQKSRQGDIVRITVDVDEKTLAKSVEGEAIEALATRRFAQLQEALGDYIKPGAQIKDLSKKLGIARLVSHAFKLAAEKAFELDEVQKFEPLSVTSYADGHRMLSITGAVIARNEVNECRNKMKLSNVPGGVAGWDDLIDIQIPQLTVWEKLSLDRDVHKKTPKQLANSMNYKLHETISTVDLLTGYSTFQRFYPTFRHVLL